MKKWIVYFICVLGLSLLCSCHKIDNTTIEPSVEALVEATVEATLDENTAIEPESVTPLYSNITYSFVPDKSGAHMFDIYEVNQDKGQHQLILKATDVGFNQPDWTADGTVMAVWGWHDSRTISIYTYNTKTEVLTRLTEQKNVYDMFPHWNVSNNKIIFTRQYILENDRNELWSMNADGSNAMKIVEGYAGSWSPDGKKIVFSQVTDDNEELYTCNSDGTECEKLLATPSNESIPMWSPDGQWIMFEQFITTNGETDESSFEICILNILSGEVKKITNNDYLDCCARWSLDGTKIAFYSQENGTDDYEVFVMNNDGSAVKQVTYSAEGSNATFPSWRPVNTPVEVDDSIVIDPYTRTEKQLGDGRSFGFCEGDFNMDGLMDVFITTYEGESGLYFKTSQGFRLSPFQFSIAEDNSHDIASGDLDNDGDLDLFLVNNSSYSRVLFNDGTGNFSLSSEVYGHPDGSSLNVKLDDVDGDGDLDALVAHYKRPAQMLINDGLGHFETVDFETFTTETIKVLVTDFDQDGALDAYFVNQSRQDQIAMNIGKGDMMMMPELYGEAVSWGGASTGDLNGDSYPDVVVTNDELGTGIWINDQKGKLAKHSEYIVNSSTNVLLEDLDQDGDLDLVLTDVEKGVELYLNDGLANFEFFKTLDNSRGATTALVMDFDDDGQLDILIGRMMGGNVIYYYK